MNIYDIAKQAGVSIATVSRVLNGGVVKASTRQRILQIMEEGDYVPNVCAQGLSSQSIRIAGILVSDIDDLYYARAVAVLERELKQRGYDLILYSTGRELSKAGQYIALMMGRRIDGLFLIGSKFQRLTEEELKAAEKIPVIGINADFGEGPPYSLLTDDRAAVRDTVLRLAGLGHRRFLYVYDTDTPSGRGKREGFREGVRAAGLPPEGQGELFCPRDCRKARQLVGARLREEAYTAVVTAEDELAVGAVKAALDCGKPVPEAVSVVGYDCSRLSVCCIPELSSVDNRVDDLCRQAVEVFARVLEGETVERRRLFGCRFIEKETTGPAPQAAPLRKRPAEIV